MSRALEPRRLSPIAVLVTAIVLALTSSANAGEVLGDLDLRLDVVEIRTDGGRDSGIAVIDVALGAFVDARDIRVDIFRSEGTPSSHAVLPIDPGVLSWSRAGETSPVILGNVLTLPARDRLVARFEVPFETAGVYEVVLKATGESESGVVRTGAMILVPVGTGLARPVEVEGAAEFRAVPSREVRP
jgi:hypothetical protein